MFQHVHDFCQVHACPCFNFSSHLLSLAKGLHINNKSPEFLIDNLFERIPPLSSCNSTSYIHTLLYNSRHMGSMSDCWQILSSFCFFLLQREHCFASQRLLHLDAIKMILPNSYLIFISFSFSLTLLSPDKKQMPCSTGSMFIQVLIQLSNTDPLLTVGNYLDTCKYCIM